MCIRDSNAIKMEMIDQIGNTALTENVTYGEKTSSAVLPNPVRGQM